MNIIFSFLLSMLIIFIGDAQIPAHVIRVKDGDTFVAKWNNRLHDCRMAHIDAPELNQLSGPEAYQYLRSLIEGQLVQLTVSHKDLYGRMIVHVSFESMRMDSLMIRRGWAWNYTAYSTEEMLEHCMRLAVKERAGLWKCGTTHVCPPWLFRKYHYRNKAIYCNGCK